MGCDIHAFIEYENKRYKRTEWESLSYDQISLSRDYTFFNLLAGVRGNGYAIVKPRGIPNDLSWAARHKYCTYITDKDIDDSNEYCSKALAADYVDKGLSVMLDDAHISNPDWHTPSYLYAHEYDTVYSEYIRQVKSTPEITWKMTAYILNELLKQGYESRLVFWFDN